MGTQPSKPIKAVSSVDEKQALAAQYSAPKEMRYDDKRPASTGMSIESLAQWNDEVKSDPSLQLSRLILHNSDPHDSLMSREALLKDNQVFNLPLKGLGPKHEYPGPRVNQASSGRCWLFATTNVLRYNVIDMLKLGDFQLSQSYLFFYDKLEKANYFLENMIELADEPSDGRVVSFLRQSPVGDGGQWDMAVNILEKYGCVPREQYPESFSSMASAKLNQIVTSKLREFSIMIRSSLKARSTDSARKMKAEMMRQIYSTLCVTLGSPPNPNEPFTWEYNDSDDKFHSWTGTPKEFYAQFAQRKAMPPRDSFSLINDPRNDYEKLYTVERLGNVWNARAVKYVNAPIEVLEDAVIAGIKANTPLFFGCDVGKSSDRVKGVMDAKLFDLKLAYGFDLDMDKAQRLETGESQMTHAMVITAVHLDDNGRPLKYKVENSWNDTVGEKGWFMMTAEWFREYVYQVVIPRTLAEKKYVEVYDKNEPVVLNPWDPMGALA